MLARPALRQRAQHSVSEHKEVDDILAEMDTEGPNSDRWAELFSRVKSRLLHHIEEEEREMFPAAENCLTAAESASLAAKFAARKPAEAQRAQGESSGGPQGATVWQP
jgi:hypothetical protein